MKKPRKTAQPGTKRNRKNEQRRRRAPKLSRDHPSIVEKPMILIVCEGKNTEPSYFRQFRLTSAKIKPVGEGYNTLSLVQRACELSEADEYDQVWCVFDKDDFPASNFNAAIAKAKSKGFKVAYSNQAFEYWLVLHFDDHQGGGLDRANYQAIINKFLKPFKVYFDGKGSKVISPDFFEILNGFCPISGKNRCDQAIARAKRNLSKHSSGNPAKEESSTMVFLLVEELMKYI